MSSSSKPQEQEYEMTDYGFKRYNICGMRFETTPNYAVKKAVGQVRPAPAGLMELAARASPPPLTSRRRPDHRARRAPTASCARGATRTRAKR